MKFRDCKVEHKPFVQKCAQFLGEFAAEFPPKTMGRGAKNPMGRGVVGFLYLMPKNRLRPFPQRLLRKTSFIFTSFFTSFKRRLLRRLLRRLRKRRKRRKTFHIVSSILAIPQLHKRDIPSMRPNLLSRFTTFTGFLKTGMHTHSVHWHRHFTSFTTFTTFT